MKLVKHNKLIKTVTLDNGDTYQIEKINNTQLLICDQNVNIKDKVETITIDYKHHCMTGFQFRKYLQKLQYRWFNIHTLTKTLTNSHWKNI